MKNPLRLLLVEDSEDDAALLLRELRRGGYQPVCERVETAAEMTKALQEKWDLVIADYILPHFNGLEALRMVHHSGRDLPFIIFSGKIGEETAVEAMRAGVDDYVLKDNLARLVPAIQRELADAVVRRERTKAQTALRESAARLREAQRIGLMGNWQYDVTSGEIFWSEQVYRLFGRDPGLGAPSLREVLSYYYPASRKLVEECFRRAVEAGERSEVDLRLKRRDGEPAYQLTVITPVRDDDGCVFRLAGIVQDITARKQIEEMLKRTSEQLEIEREALERKNIALREVLNQIDAEKRILKQQVATNLERAILPTLRRLKETCHPAQLRNFELLEQELREIASTFLHTLKNEFDNLSPRELEICRLIKNGLASKEIAQDLHLSLLTVHKYRELIRKKLGLVNQAINLNTYLQSI
jgi:DNA-binding NarL/FixJ family response regulator